MPYIALQLKAVAHTFDLIAGLVAGTGDACPGSSSTTTPSSWPPWSGGFSASSSAPGASTPRSATRGWWRPSPWSRWSRSVAFVAVGLFVTYGLFDGFGDIFSRFLARLPRAQATCCMFGTRRLPYGSWFTLGVICMMAFMFLPRQFHIMVVENSDEEHIRSAMWRFPASTCS